MVGTYSFFYIIIWLSMKMLQSSTWFSEKVDTYFSGKYTVSEGLKKIKKDLLLRMKLLPCYNTPFININKEG